MNNQDYNSITDVPGIIVGHVEDTEALTGCTIILCEQGAIGGMDQRGGAPGTRQVDSLRPMRLVNELHGVLLSGGSAFGLEAATGVVRYLEERGIGLDVNVARIPIVPTAILFDLSIGKSDVRPDADSGYAACLNASAEPPSEGNVGAGCGATAGKILGMDHAMKSGIGTSSQDLGNGVIVGAIVAVNPFGDVIDPANGDIIAGSRFKGEDKHGASPEHQFANSLDVLKSMSEFGDLQFGRQENTVIGVVGTNARLNKEEVNKVAQMAQCGIARTIRPAHTMLDGDTMFALATGEIEVDVNIVGAFAAEVIADAIQRAVWAAEPAGDLPSASSIRTTT